MPTLSPLANRLKVQLRLSIERLRIVQNNDIAVSKQQRKKMAELLEQGREESARIRVENIIRSDLTTELYEILELYCELLIARIGLIDNSKDLDPGLEEAIQSLLYAQPRIEIKELLQVREALTLKYGRDYVAASTENTRGKVPARVLDRLKVEPPAKELIQMYLETIADAYEIPWPQAKHKAITESQDSESTNNTNEQTEKVVSNDAAALDAHDETQELTAASPPRDLTPKIPVTIIKPHATIDNLSPKVKVNVKESNLTDVPIVDAFVAKDSKVISASKSNLVNTKSSDISDLARRFALLKR